MRAQGGEGENGGWSRPGQRGQPSSRATPDCTAHAVLAATLIITHQPSFPHHPPSHQRPSSFHICHLIAHYVRIGNAVFLGPNPTFCGANTLPPCGPHPHPALYVHRHLVGHPHPSTLWGHIHRAHQAPKWTRHMIKHKVGCWSFVEGD